MQDPRWKSLEEAEPGMEDADKNGRILAWHRHNGAMLIHPAITRTTAREFITHWQPTPRTSDGRWVSFADRGPEAEDCDAQGCVLAWEPGHGAQVVHRGNLENGRYSRWMRLPGKPEGAAAAAERAPCMGCRDRKRACSDECEAYKRYKDRLEISREAEKVEYVTAKTGWRGVRVEK